MNKKNIQDKIKTKTKFIFFSGITGWSGFIGFVYYYSLMTGVGDECHEHNVNILLPVNQLVNSTSITHLKKPASSASVHDFHLYASCEGLHAPLPDEDTLRGWSPKRPRNKPPKYIYIFYNLFYFQLVTTPFKKYASCVILRSFILNIYLLFFWFRNVYTREKEQSKVKETHKDAAPFYFCHLYCETGKKKKKTKSVF